MHRTEPVVLLPRCLAGTTLLLLAACGPGVIVLEDAQNYAFTTDLTADCQTVPAGEDSLVDWSGLSTDLQHHAMDPTTQVSEVRLVRFLSLTQEEVLERISMNGIDMADILETASYVPVSGQTSAWLTEFDFFGTPVVPEKHVLDDGRTYLVAAITGLYEYRMLTFFCPETGAEPTTVRLLPDSAVLTFEVDIDAGEPIPEDGSEVDWTGLRTDGLGNEFPVSNVDGLLVGRYEPSIGELETSFFDLPALADPAWEADVEGRGRWDLTTLETDEGLGWSSFEAGWTWLVALRCSTCTNPAPLFLGVVR
ncbi:MAG: hypothetical protein JXB39_16475 [Deltaproteobacteria bacterium]|nr:hypothetical protein [Deltaproteobacteria bacterium]